MESFYEICYPNKTAWDDRQISQEVLSSIRNLAIPVEYAICSLIREPLSIEEQKKNGVFYTDYRLAEMISTSVYDTLTKDSRVADLAAGTGILLIGVARAYMRKYRSSFNEWISSNLFAFDLSDYALRGAIAALISMTDNMQAIVKMISHWGVCDSLFNLPAELPPFDVIVGNPPWGRIKLSTPTYLSRIGVLSAYGTTYPVFDETTYAEEKNAINEYSKKVRDTYSLLKGSEPDMYMAFLQCAIENLKDDGRLAFIIPSGIIRSEGTYNLREHLIKSGSDLDIVLLDNKRSYFSIDSRFKFVILNYSPRGEKEPLESISFLNWCNSSQKNLNRISIPTTDLQLMRPDLTLPEVRNEEELSLFFKLYMNGIVISEMSREWTPRFSRELDMTNDKHRFIRSQDPDSLAVVEGRMVQQYRFGSKEYVSGEGRSAIWIPSTGKLSPQYYIPKSELNNEQLSRCAQIRVGYCDIAGQTNERAMMSTIIPPGVICGNKVPTITFPSDPTGNIAYFWVGVTNSFVFDWMIRRIISTTVNYFHILSLPFPKINSSSADFDYIVTRVKQLISMKSDYYNNDKMPNIRTEIEVKIAQLYGISESDFQVIIRDFPLIDKKQPRIPCEESVTFNTILKRLSTDPTQIQHYASIDKEYKLKGANAYIPSEMTALGVAR